MQKIKKAISVNEEHLKLPRISARAVKKIWTEEIKSLPRNFKSSAKELQDLRKLVFCGLMAALAVILSATTTIKLGPYLRIGFSGYPNRIVEYLLGPVIGSLFGGVLDILKYFLADGDGMFFFRLYLKSYACRTDCRYAALSETVKTLAGSAGRISAENADQCVFGHTLVFHSLWVWVYGNSAGTSDKKYHSMAGGFRSSFYDSSDGFKDSKACLERYAFGVR